MFNNFYQNQRFYPNSSYDQLSRNQAQQGFNPYPQQQQTNTNMMFVNGVEGAKAFQVSPNSSVLLLDSENSKFYVKTSDNLGMPKLTSYSFTEDGLQAAHKQEAPQQQETVSISKQEFEGLLAKIAEFDEFRVSTEKMLKELM